MRNQLDVQKTSTCQKKSQIYIKWSGIRVMDDPQD